MSKSPGFGTKAYFSTDGVDFTKKFSHVTKVTPPSMSRNMVDMSDMNSFDDNDQMKEEMPGYIEGGDATIEGFYKESDTAMEAAKAAFYAGIPVWIKIDLPDRISETYVVQGYISSLQEIGDIDPENGVPYSLTVKTNKKPTKTTRTTTT